MNSILKVLVSIGLATALGLFASCTKAGAEGAPTQNQGAPALSSVTLTVEGMTCASCSVSVRTALKKLDGVREARVSVEEKRAVVDYEPTKVTPQKMVDAVNKLGYRASLASKGS